MRSTFRNSLYTTRAEARDSGGGDGPQCQRNVVESHGNSRRQGSDRDKGMEQALNEGHQEAPPGERKWA